MKMRLKQKKFSKNLSGIALDVNDFVQEESKKEEVGRTKYRPRSQWGKGKSDLEELSRNKVTSSTRKGASNSKES